MLSTVVIVFLCLALLVVTWFFRRTITNLKSKFEYDISYVKSEHALAMLDQKMTFESDFSELAESYENEFLQYREVDTKQKQIIADLTLGVQLMHNDAIGE